VENASVMCKRLKRQIARGWRGLLWRMVHMVWQSIQRVGQVTADTAGGRAFREFGGGSVMVFPTGSVFGQKWITIGSDTLIGAQVTMSAGLVPGQDLGLDPVLRIGDRCVIGRGSHIVAHANVRIEDDVWTGPYVYITDQNHGYADPGMPIGRQIPVNRPVSIGAGSWLGAGVVVLPGAQIGCNVVVAAGSVVRGEVPDRCVVAGVPAKIVREYTEAGWLPPLAGTQARGGELFLLARAEGVEGIAQAGHPAV
jgi:acetyltransferase-like isoleucine patch superfamily enzyme